MARSKDKRLKIAEHMPPLRKKQPGMGYDVERDEVAQWVASQPELIGFLAAKLADWGYIRYDPETHTWKGVDYGADQFLHADGTADLHAPRETGEGGQGQAGVL